MKKVISLIKKITRKILLLIFKLVPYSVDIAFVEYSFPSGSNTRILYNYMKENYEYKLLVIEKKSSKKLIGRVLDYIRYNYRLASAKILLGTHGVYKIKKKSNFYKSLAWCTT